MIRAIIFDIGNVLLRFDFARSVRKQRCDAEVDSLLRALDPLRHAYECGKMERGKFLKRAKAALQFAGSDAEFIAAYEDIFTENLPMTQLVPLLRKQLPLYLLSNTSELHIDYITRTYPVFRFFRRRVLPSGGLHKAGAWNLRTGGPAVFRRAAGNGLHRRPRAEHRHRARAWVCHNPLRPRAARGVSRHACPAWTENLT